MNANEFSPTIYLLTMTNEYTFTRNLLASPTRKPLTVIVVNVGVR